MGRILLRLLGDVGGRAAAAFGVIWRSEAGRSSGGPAGGGGLWSSFGGPGSDLTSAAWRSRRIVLKESYVGQRLDLTQAAYRCGRTAAAFGVVWRSGGGPYSDRLAVPVSVGRLVIVVWRSGTGSY